MLPDSCGFLEKKIDDFKDLYKLAEKAYKSSQLITTKIDVKIHNEFHYCARGLAEIITLLSEIKRKNTLSDPEKVPKIELRILSKLLRADHAVRNILNDSIDLIVAHSRLLIKEMAAIENDKTIDNFIPNIEEILENINIVAGKISNSRKNLKTRISVYEEILNSNEYKEVKKFCNNSIVTLDRIKKYSIERRDRLIKENNESQLKIIESTTQANLTKERINEIALINQKTEQRIALQKLFGIFTIMSATVTVVTFIIKTLNWWFDTHANSVFLGIEKWFR